ncbi:MAG: macro domain-containing protein [Candidatus Acidiferrales bacterium]
MADKIVFEQGDITDAVADAIVNAANTDLQLGAGVAGAIRVKGGPEVQAECDRIGSIPLGEAAVTGGGKLKVKYVIHAASMRLGSLTTAESLRASTRNSLLRAAEKGIKTIAFPAVGTGIAGFPMDEGAEIMLEEVVAHLGGKTSLEQVRFVLFDAPSLRTFQEVWKRMKKEGKA